MLQEKDVIFEIFQYATERAKVVGAENIYDFSLGNPSVPAPSIVNETIVQKVNTLDPLALHGYSPSFGIMETREKIAVFLNKKYGSSYKASNIFMAIGAAGALAHAFRAVTNPGHPESVNYFLRTYFRQSSVTAMRMITPENTNCRLVSIPRIVSA